MVKMPDALALARQYRAAVLRKDAAALSRLISAYGAMWKRIEKDVQLLIKEMELIEAAGGVISKGKITRLAQYKDLLDGVERELGQYGHYMTTQLSQDARTLMGQANHDVSSFLRTMGYGGKVATLRTDVIETLLGFLDPKGPLMRYWIENKGGQDTAKRIAQTILTSVGKGKNPRVLAKLIQADMGDNLTSALKTARTVQLTAYREATRANYKANGIEKWQWYAQLDGDTCAACVSMHGEVFDTETPAEGHYNCRCVMLPVTIFSDPDKMQKGEDWFKEQDEATQQKIMGKSKLEAWQNGAFKFGDLSRETEDPVFGYMRTETSLADLIGQEAVNNLRSK